MARIRTTKPEFWTDGKVVQMSPFARLLFLGSWNFALCDDGHLPDDVFGLKLKVLPADDVNPEELLDELLFAGVIVRATLPDGRSYLHIRNLRGHQKVDGRWTPRCFVCAQDPAKTRPSSSNPTETRASLDESRGDSPQERKGKESKGRTTAPPASRGTRIPDGFTPSSNLIEFAATLGINRAQAEAVTAEFVDYWRGVAGAKGVKLDWDGTWRNWVRRQDPTKIRVTNVHPITGTWTTDRLDAVLGPDRWRLPQPPSGLTPDEQWEWSNQQRAARRADRIRQAETKQRGGVA